MQSFTDTLTTEGTADLMFRFTDVLKAPVGLQYGSISQSIDLGAQEFVSKVFLRSLKQPCFQFH